MNWNLLIRNIYYLLKRILNSLNFIFRELFKDTSYLKGEDFEYCLRQKIFTSNNYDLVMKTHDYHENSKDFVESTLYPDYLFRNRSENKEFWVEAKYRENLFEGKIEWCKPYQFIRYKKLGKEKPIIIAIGFGGRPKNPDKIFLVPLEEIEYNSLYLNFLNGYEYQSNRKNILDILKDKAYDYKK